MAAQGRSEIAVLRAALELLALPAEVRAEVRRFLEAADPSEAETLPIQEAASLWGELTESEQESFARTIKRIYAEDEPARRHALASELSQHFTEKSSSTEQDAPPDRGGGLLGEEIDGRFRIEAPIGRGGFGAVYRARDTLFDVPCAVKVALSSDAELRDRFRREAQIGFRLGRQPGVVRAYHFGNLNNGAGQYLAMDLVAGAGTLDLSGGPMQARLRRLLKASQLVAAVHRQGFLHRDIKPANFLVAADGSIHLADFGLAKARGVAEPELSEAASRSGLGGMAGTPAYMPPEQFEDFSGVDHRADVYALGVMLYKTLCGELPFGQGLTEVASRQASARVGALAAPDPRLKDPGCPELLAELCCQALALDRPRRLASVEELVFGIAAGLSAPLAPALTRAARDLARQRSAESQGRAASARDSLAPLRDRDRWKDAGEARQDRAIAEVQRRLGEAFALVETRAYSCAGQTHRIASFRHRKSGAELQLIPAGRFLMGSMRHKDERPVHLCVIERPFLLGRALLSQREWDRIGGEDGRRWLGEALPIDSLSWIAAREWLRAAGDGLRLPSESEWEYACRAGSATEYYWGEAMDGAHCWFADNSGERTHAAGEHRARTNAFGLIDCLGNLGEWCQDDWLEDYREGPSLQGPRGDGKGAYRVVRGGSWFDEAPQCRSAFRLWFHPDKRSLSIGLRIARSID